MLPDVGFMKQDLLLDNKFKVLFQNKIGFMRLTYLIIKYTLQWSQWKIKIHLTIFRTLRKQYFNIWGNYNQALVYLFIMYLQWHLLIKKWKIKTIMELMKSTIIPLPKKDNFKTFDFLFISSFIFLFLLKLINHLVVKNNDKIKNSKIKNVQNSKLFNF